MVPDTEFTIALNKPIDVVQDLYKKVQDDSKLVEEVEAHFRNTFSSPESRAKISTLTPANVPTLLHSNKLVRFRCMIQDTGLGTEVFLSSQKQGSTTLTGLFGGESRFQDHQQDEGQDAFSGNNLAERSVMYAVSVPGQTRWAAEAHRESTPSSSTAAASSHSNSVSNSEAGIASLSIEEPQSPQKIQEVRDRIKRAVERGKAIGSTGKEPRLVAISKLHPPSAILAAYRKAGQLHFGENYVQEMVDKAKVLPREIRWHFVGGLQSNKGKLLASIPNLYLLETLDSIKAANVLEKALSSPDAAKRDEPLRVYLQVNTSGEDAKSGLAPILSSDTQQDSLLLDLATHVITKCPHLRFRGVMTIGAAANSAESGAAEPKSVDEVIKANPDFQRLIETRENLVKLLRASDQIKACKEAHIQEAYIDLLEGGHKDGGLELSMGMSADMDVAVMAGSDNVRVGTDCFGRRPGTRDEAMTGMKRELEVGPEAAMAEKQSSVKGDSGFTAAGLTRSSGRSFQDPYPQKAPLPDEPHVGSLLKFYDLDAADKFKTAEVVEAVGILNTASLPHAEWKDTGAAQESESKSSNAEIPCIHVVFANTADVNSLSSSLASEAPASNGTSLGVSSERSELIGYIAGALGGDKVAAELVLLAVIARIHARRASLCLGSLTLNLSNFPSPTNAASSASQTELFRRLSHLLPAVVEIPMDLSTLNDPKKSLFPKSSGGSTGLESGRLQLPNGATILINEGGMREGELKDVGIRNIKALSSVLESHKLPYAFPFSEFEFDTDLNAVILSQGKSFLPFDIQCPLQPTNASCDLYSASQEQVSEEKLNGWRASLLQARSLKTAKDFKIPEEVSNHIQQEFVDERRREQAAKQASHGGQTDASEGLGQEDLLRRMAIVRLLAISHGEESLSLESWKKAVQLDTMLTERIKSTHQNQSKQQQQQSPMPSASR